MSILMYLFFFVFDIFDNHLASLKKYLKSYLRVAYIPSGPFLISSYCKNLFQILISFVKNARHDLSPFRPAICDQKTLKINCNLPSYLQSRISQNSKSYYVQLLIFFKFVQREEFKNDAYNKLEFTNKNCFSLQSRKILKSSFQSLNFYYS